MADPAAINRPEILRSASLKGVPHGFCGAIAHGAPPQPDWIVPGGQLVLVKQVHSAEAIAVSEPFAEDQRPEVDAMASAAPGLVLGIVTADCAPMLLADRQAGVIGAAHAGWRGAFGGVIEAVIARMEELGARRAHIAAAIGPAIAQASYEVDEAFRARFLAQTADNARFFVAGAGERAGHHQFDLPAYVAHRLARAGIETVDDLGEDTYCQEARFHSFRRATHKAQPTYGRQFSLVALPL